jgi:hypothetical protein
MEIGVPVVWDWDWDNDRTARIRIRPRPGFGGLLPARKAIEPLFRIVYHLQSGGFWSKLTVRVKTANETFPAPGGAAEKR